MADSPSRVENQERLPLAPYRKLIRGWLVREAPPALLCETETSLPQATWGAIPLPGDYTRQKVCVKEKIKM